jgi:16S rRNA (guanine966-N2)-methyltransferase
MRIIAGVHRGRSLKRPPAIITRPTMDRVREAIFNMLTHGGWEGDKNIIEGAIVLDAFAGSGALALEALSRGAAFAYFFDQSEQALAVVRQNVKSLGEEERSKLLKTDACRPLKVLQAATLILLDPPFGKDLLSKSLPGLFESGWIAPNALIMAEIQAKETYVLPANFEVLKEKIYGTAKVIFIKAPSEPSISH